MGYRMVNWKCSICGSITRRSGKHGTPPEGAKRDMRCADGCKGYGKPDGYFRWANPTPHTVQPYSTSKPKARKPKRPRSYFR